MLSACLHFPMDWAFVVFCRAIKWKRSKKKMTTDGKKIFFLFFFSSRISVDGRDEWMTEWTNGDTQKLFLRYAGVPSAFPVSFCFFSWIIQ